MTYIVTYDISDNRIRAKLARHLEKSGVRIQKSVFAVKMERYHYKRFTRTLKSIAGPEGDIIIFRLCAGCSKQAEQLAALEHEPWIF